MKQVFDRAGFAIKGMFKKPDGSIVVHDDDAYNRSRLQHENINALNNEVAQLKEQVKQILEHINGKS